MGDFTTEIVRCSQFGIRDRGAALEDDDLGVLVEPACPGRGAHASGDAPDDEESFTHGSALWDRLVFRLIAHDRGGNREGPSNGGCGCLPGEIADLQSTVKQSDCCVVHHHSNRSASMFARIAIRVVFASAILQSRRRSSGKERGPSGTSTQWAIKYNHEDFTGKNDSVVSKWATEEEARADAKKRNEAETDRARWTQRSAARKTKPPWARRKISLLKILELEGPRRCCRQWHEAQHGSCPRGKIAKR